MSSLPFVLCLLFASPAGADDWAQYRRDAVRSATSTDRVKVPLTDIWTIESALHDGHTPLFNAAVWRGRAYAVACEGNTRYLVCADQLTGRIIWRQPLVAPRLQFVISDVAGPAVTDSGIVYVYDWLSDGRTLNQRAAKLINVEEVYRTDTGETLYQKTSSLDKSPLDRWLPSFCVRAFRADSGAPGAGFLLSTMGANGVLPRLHLLHDNPGQTVIPVPPTIMGCPP